MLFLVVMILPFCDSVFAVPGFPTQLICIVCKFSRSLLHLSTSAALQLVVEHMPHYTGR
jgi:hypothetical protein